MKESERQSGLRNRDFALRVEGQGALEELHCPLHFRGIRLRIGPRVELSEVAQIVLAESSERVGKFRLFSLSLSLSLALSCVSLPLACSLSLFVSLCLFPLALRSSRS